VIGLPYIVLLGEEWAELLCRVLLGLLQELSSLELCPYQLFKAVLLSVVPPSVELIKRDPTITIGVNHLHDLLKEYD
jgi:hypothetical protein